MAAQQNSTSPPRTFIFDLGKVIVDFDHMTFCANLAPFCSVPAAAVYDRIFRSGIEKRFDSGSLSPAAFFEAVRAELSFTIDMDHFSRLWCDIFTLQEEIDELIRGLKGRYRLLCLSNTNPWHFTWCDDHFPVLNIFNDRILSYEEKCCKPDTAIYKRALAKAQAPAGQCFFIDDSAENAAAARELGIRAIVFTTPAALTRELTAAGISWPGQSS